MLNQTVLVGRLVKEPVIEEIEDRKYCNITLAVQRSFKNAEGIYEEDIIPITLWNGIAQNTSEYCKKGDVIGVKGRLETKIIENEDGTKNYKLELVAEKVTFLSSKKVDEE